MSDFGFSGIVPLFPLPNVVLFPQTVLPLHIFEPRYREMTARALGGEKLIAMALLKPGWEPEYQGNPAVHDVVGVGRIVNEKEREGGRYDLLLYGVCRARVVEIVSDDPYRTARVEVLHDRIEDEAAKALEAKRLGLLAVYSTLVRETFGNDQLLPDAGIAVGTLCDVLTAFVNADVREKQAILEELDVVARIERVVEMLRKSPLGGKPVSSGLRESRKAWPPPPKLN